MTVLKKTPLTHLHLEGKAKCAPFAGFEMPLWYTSLKEEHLAVRSQCGLFDVCHMGLLSFTGADARETLEKLSCSDLSKSDQQMMVYSMILNQEGGILDDVMIGQFSERYIMIVNASNYTKIRDWALSHAIGDTQINTLNSHNGLMAIQGPKATDILSQVLGEAVHEIKRFRHATLNYNNQPVTLMRTGYTGEDGFEIMTDHDTTVSIWMSLIESGAAPAGLAARDTLRMEAGLPLYGQELSETINPRMTRYSWVLKSDGDYIGKTAIDAITEPALVTIGLEITERMIPRTGYAIEEGGTVTSGTLSPSLETPIAMAMVPPSLSEIGTELTVLIRQRAVKAKVVSLPFLKK